MTMVGIVLFIVALFMSDLLIHVYAVLIAITGVGLSLLGRSDIVKDSTDSINVFIGKQLFKKGLSGLIIGVLVGSLRIIFNK